MNDSTLSDLPGIELDAEMVERILYEGNHYSQQTADLARFLLNNKAEFRERLIQQGLIQVANPDVTGFELAAVDGASAIKPRGGGALVAAAAYKSTLNDEIQRGIPRIIRVPNNPQLAAFATLLRTHLELCLLTPDKLDLDMIVVLDHSFWGVMQAVSRGLAAYKQQRIEILEAGRNPELDAMQIAWTELFRDSLGLEGSFLRMARNKRVISLSKTGMSQYFVNMLLEQASQEVKILSSTLNDRAILRHILQPNEYTTPQSLYRTVQESSTIKSWKRSRFATHFEDTPNIRDPFEARTEVFDEYGIPRGKGDDQEIQERRLFVTYYRPAVELSRVYRIELHELMLFSKGASRQIDISGQGERFQKVLSSVKQSINPEIKEPMAQVLADLRAKSATSAAIKILPERAFYQLRDKYRGDEEILDIIDTLLAEERT